MAERSKPAIRANKVTPESLITASIEVENIKVKPIIKPQLLALKHLIEMSHQLFAHTTWW